jgi:hypothetical protein
VEILAFHEFYEIERFLTAYLVAHIWLTESSKKIESVVEEEIFFAYLSYFIIFGEIRL